LFGLNREIEKGFIKCDRYWPDQVVSEVSTSSDPYVEF